MCLRFAYENAMKMPCHSQHFWQWNCPGTPMMMNHTIYICHLHFHLATRWVMMEDRLMQRWQCGRTHLHIYLWASLLLGTATVNRFIYLLLSPSPSLSPSLRWRTQMQVNYSIPFVFCILSLRVPVYFLFSAKNDKQSNTYAHFLHLQYIDLFDSRRKSAVSQRNGREKKNR